MNAINKYLKRLSSPKKLNSSAKSVCLSTFLMSCFLAQNSFAQFNVDAQLRNRFEFRDGYKKLAEQGTDPAIFISQRTRISFNFENKQLKVRFTPQDVRVWGNEQLSSSTGVFGDNASLDLFEAFAQIKTGENAWFSVGRQQLVYDGQRILAARNWNQNGISYDAVIFKWKAKEWEIHAGGSWNSTGENSSDNYYDPERLKTLNFIWAKHKLSDNWHFSVSHIASGVTETKTDNKLYFKQTSGLYTQLNCNGINFSGDLYYQFGKNNANQKVRAWLFDANLSYKTTRNTTGIGVSYLSGNKNTTGKIDHLFDVLYGARHRFFGEIDYFSNFSSHTKQGGLADYYFYTELKLNGKTSIKNTGHYFNLAQTNENTLNNKKLGYENDLTLKQKFADWGTLECAYLFFLPTKTLKTIQNVSSSKFSQFIYVQLTVTPVLFKN